MVQNLAPAQGVALTALCFHLAQPSTSTGSYLSHPSHRVCASAQSYSQRHCGISSLLWQLVPVLEELNSQKQGGLPGSARLSAPGPMHERRSKQEDVFKNRYFFTQETTN